MIICDLDYTIVNTNTTYDFLSCLFPLKYKILSILLRPLISLTKIFNIDIYKKILVMLCLKGKSRNTIESYSKIYVNNIINSKTLNNELLNIIHNYEGKKILLSASLDIIVNSFRHIGFDYTIGSKMQFTNDKFIRFYDIYGKKNIYIKELSKKYKNIIIIDDSPERKLFLLKNQITILSPEEAITYFD